MVSNARKNYIFGLVLCFTTYPQPTTPPKRAIRTDRTDNFFPQEEKRSIFVGRGDHPCPRLAWSHSSEVS